MQYYMTPLPGCPEQKLEKHVTYASPKTDLQKQRLSPAMTTTPACMLL